MLAVKPIGPKKNYFKNWKGWNGLLDNCKSFYKKTFFWSFLTILILNENVLIFYYRRDDMKYDANHRATFFLLSKFPPTQNKNIFDLSNILKIEFFQIWLQKINYETFFLLLWNKMKCWRNNFLKSNVNGYFQ